MYICICIGAECADKTSHSFTRSECRHGMYHTQIAARSLQQPPSQPAITPTTPSHTAHIGQHCFAAHGGALPPCSMYIAASTVCAKHASIKPRPMTVQTHPVTVCCSCTPRRLQETTLDVPKPCASTAVRHVCDATQQVLGCCIPLHATLLAAALHCRQLCWHLPAKQVCLI